MNSRIRMCLRMAWGLIVVGGVLASMSATAATVVVVGDSISAGYGVPVSKTWVTLLANKIEPLGHTVINASISGDTTAGGLSRLPALLRQHRPAVVIIQLGANDAQRGLQMKATRQNLLTMVRDSHKAGAKALLIPTAVSPALGKTYAREFQVMYPKVARDSRAVLLAGFLDKVMIDPDLMQADHIHPNSLAQPILTDTAWKSLAPLLK